MLNTQKDKKLENCFSTNNKTIRKKNNALSPYFPAEKLSLPLSE